MARLGLKSIPECSVGFCINTKNSLDRVRPLLGRQTFGSMACAVSKPVNGCHSQI